MSSTFSNPATAEQEQRALLKLIRGIAEQVSPATEVRDEAFAKLRELTHRFFILGVLGRAGVKELWYGLVTLRRAADDEMKAFLNERLDAIEKWQDAQQNLIKRELTLEYLQLQMEQAMGLYLYTVMYGKEKEKTGDAFALDYDKPAIKLEMWKDWFAKKTEERKEKERKEKPVTKEQLDFVNAVVKVLIKRRLDGSADTSAFL